MAEPYLGGGMLAGLLGGTGTLVHQGYAPPLDYTPRNYATAPVSHGINPWDIVDPLGIDRAAWDLATASPYGALGAFRRNMETGANPFDALLGAPHAAVTSLLGIDPKYIIYGVLGLVALVAFNSTKNGLPPITVKA